MPKASEHTRTNTQHNRQKGRAFNATRGTANSRRRNPRERMRATGPSGAPPIVNKPRGNKRNQANCNACQRAVALSRANRKQRARCANQEGTRGARRQSISIQITPDQPRSIQISPDQHRSIQISPDQLRSIQIGPDQPRSSQISPDQLRSPRSPRSIQTHPDQSRSIQISPDQS